VSARDKYIHIFGQISSLAERISWSTGVSNMLEWLVWSTNNVLGVTKTDYYKQIVRWTHENPVRDGTLDEKERYVSLKLKAELKKSEQHDRYSPPKYSIASAREVLRRAKFFSEDYLNKEFDIFRALVSDRYLDAFYRQFTQIVGNGSWFTHGNSGIFGYSTGIDEMQMDNLSYNPTEAILVANELKLGGKKNKDQILKYALMFRLLRDREFVAPNSRFLLLFIGDKKENLEWSSEISKEIDYCQRSPKSTAKAALHPEVVKVAESAEYAATSWNDLMTFNDSYVSSLNSTTQQVEQKLLRGFNETLMDKKFMQNSR